MKLHPRLSRAAVELVIRFETFHPTAQPAAGGGWTVGYGHTRSARELARVSRQDGETLLLYDLAAAAEVVEANMFAPIGQHQFDALTAFCFNIGAENFRSSSALARINAGAELEAADEIERWRRAELGAGPQVVDALVRRRAAEKAHFLGLPDGFSKSPSAVLRPLPGADGQGWETPPPPIEPVTASATLTAAHSVQARLRELVPEPEAPPYVQPAPEPALAPEGEPEPKPERWEEPVSQALIAEPLPTEFHVSAPARVGSAPYGGRPKRPPVSPAPYIAPPPPPPAHDLAAQAAQAANDSAVSRAPLAAASSPATPVGASAGPGVGTSAVSSPKFTARRVYAVLAVFGGCLFLAAAALILAGRPTLANLVLGVCGVGLMTPGVYGLLGPGGSVD